MVRLGPAARAEADPINLELAVRADLEERGRSLQVRALMPGGARIDPHRAVQVSHRRGTRATSGAAGP